ncbi:hypothetical protein GYB22_12365 [bacterium]|nr:hypothetical protein [bacterium]
MRLLSILFMLIAASTAFAQTQIVCLSSEDGVECSEYIDSFQTELLLKNWRMQQRAEGFLASGVDSSFTKGDSLIYYLSKGTKFNYINITSNNFTLGSEEYFPQKKLSYKQFNSNSKRLLDFMENNGYPFASIRLDSGQINKDTIQFSVFFDPGVQILYDTLSVLGNSKLSKNYLYNFLDIKPGELYNELNVKAIDKKIRNLPLVKVNAPAKIYFFQGLARVQLNIDERVTDRFDGVVGVAPNSANSEDNSLLVTGELNVELNNLFGSAKQLELHWRNYLQRSQLLDVGFTYPYLLNTKLGIHGEFNLNKFDTIFVNLNSKIGFRYQSQGNNYFQVYYQFTGSNLLTVDTGAVRSQKRIPTNNPFRIDNYGLAVSQSDFDYLPNPRKGYSIYTDFAIGLKQLQRDLQVESVAFPNPDGPGTISIYDTLNLRSLRARVEFKGIFHIPLFKQSTLVQKVGFSAIFADQILFNELYNFGGFATLKGFDENEIFASKFLRYTLEYRYLISQNSNVGLFFNAAAIENKLENSNDLIYDIPYGFGAVANLEVRNGVLSLAYALGSQQGNPIQFRAAKFHFGIVNFF